MSIVETTPADDHDERCVDDTNRKSCHIAANVGIPSSTNYVPSLAPIEPLFMKQQEYELECGTVCDFGELRLQLSCYVPHTHSSSQWSATRR
jgi:hypothetical protein